MLSARRLSTLLAPLLALAAPAAVRAETPEEKGSRLAIAADRQNSGFGSERARLTLELINAQKEVTTRRLVLEVLEGKDDGDRSRSTFEWPADVKGTRLLTWTHKQADDDQWLYLPSIKRVKRIASSSRSGSFMGSEFAYEDMGGQEVEKYRYRWLADVKEAGRDCYQIERIPVEKGSGYSKQVVWMDKEYALPHRIDYYDRKGELLKRAALTGHKRYGKLWRIGAIAMDNVQTKKRSVLTWENRELGVKLDPAAFESASLRD